MTSKVTIGLPVYNAAPYLAFSIASILAQTEKDWELILIDDGSLDESVEIATHFQDKRIKILSDGKNLGLASRLNQISILCQSPYLARMDADDIMHPERIYKQLKYLETAKNVDVVGSGIYTIDTNNHPYGYRTTTHVNTVAQALRGTPFVHPTVMGRVEWFLKFPYDESHDRAEDVELWSRGLPQSHYEVLDQPLLFYRELGLPYLKKYLKSSKGVRRILRERGVTHLGYTGTLIEVMSLHTKDIFYLLMSMIGCESNLLLRRNRPLTSQERTDAQEVLSEIMSFLPKTLRGFL